MKLSLKTIWLSVLAIVAISHSALAVSTTIVISQVYSGQNVGTPGGPRIRNDFIELFNLGSTAVSLNGWSLQISDTAQGNTWRMTLLAGNIGPGQYFLIQGPLRKGTAPLSQADGSTDIELPAALGRIAIRDNTALLDASSGECPISATIDYVAYGSSPVCTLQAPAMDSQQSLVRAGGGCQDTDGADFTLYQPFPRNTSSPRNACSATPFSKAYTVPASGGISFQSTGAGSSLGVGYVRIQPSSGTSTPTGLAVFSLRQGQTLISEATVPAVPLIQSAAAYVEVNGAINTGIAIANPGDSDAIIQFSFIDSSRGYPTAYGVLTVPGHGQLARFLNELPFSMTTPLQGTLLLQSSVPVGIIALRGYTNQRSEFLVTTLPVIDTSSAVSTDPTYLAHIAIGAGWSTEIMLIGRTDPLATGNVEFRDQSGNPVNVKIGVQTGTSFPYSLASKNSTKLIVTNPTSDLVAGSVRVSPTNGTVTPIAVAVFSNTPVTSGVRVSEAGLVSVRANRFRTYVEYSGAIGAVGSVRSGLAIANAGSDPATVSLELTRLGGTSTGLMASLSLAGSGQVSKFINELFPDLSAPFQGILRVTSTSPLTMIGLRARYNERNDFLITTVPAADETASTTSAEFSFPHLADSAGFATQFVLFGGAGQASSGTLRFFTPGGQPLSLDVK